MTPSMPLVSVIIPAFNAEKTIAETLQSVQKQSYRNLEIIVVDDGSTDSTATIIKSSFPDVKYLHQDNSGGCAVPRNTGVVASNGGFICFFDADDLMLPNRIKQQVELLLSDDRIGIAFCNYQNFSQDCIAPTTHFDTCPTLSSLLSEKTSIIISDACPLLLKENFGIAGSMLIRRELVKRVGGFNRDLKACEDFHFYYRVARLSAVATSKEVGFLRRIHDSNMSGDSLRMLTNHILSRSLLFADEKDEKNQHALTQFIADKHAAMAWNLTRNHKFSEALRHSKASFKWDPSPRRALQAARELLHIGYYATLK